jgi:hypothetical protein
VLLGIVVLVGVAYFIRAERAGRHGLHSDDLQTENQRLRAQLSVATTGAKQLQAGAAVQAAAATLAQRALPQSGPGADVAADKLRAEVVALKAALAASEAEQATLRSGFAQCSAQVAACESQQSLGPSLTASAPCAECPVCPGAPTPTACVCADKAANATAPAGGTITVVTATYGGNCGHPTGVSDQTAALREKCNTLPFCQYVTALVTHLTRVLGAAWLQALRRPCFHCR